MTDAPKSQYRSLPFLLSILVIGLMVCVLSAEGRIWWCKAGDGAIYINDAWSSHTSQHLFDPYSFTHVLHGVMYFWIGWLLFSKLSTNWRFLIAIIAAASWEVLENSSFIIEKYRENTASLDYFGDSIVNSIGDVLCCALGFWITVKLGRWRSLVFFILVEIVLLLWIRDSLLLNIIMLIYPSEGLKHWQIGG
jgi:hypothetical protein